MERLVAIILLLALGAGSGMVRSTTPDLET